MTCSPKFSPAKTSLLRVPSKTAEEEKRHERKPFLVKSRSLGC